MIPVSFTKTLIVKNTHPLAKGKDYSWGIAARSFVPALMLRPTSAALAGALRRHALSEDIDPEEAFNKTLRLSPSWEYKLQSDNGEPLSLREEIRLLEPFGITPGDIAAEIRILEDTDYFPLHATLPVTEVMAKVHYGLLDT
jgi:hypothetical protein